MLRSARRLSGPVRALRRLGTVTGTEGAGEVRKAHQLDEERLRQYLQHHLRTLDFSSMSIRQFGHGQSNPTYLVETACKTRLVLRKQPPGKLLRGAHAMDREYRVMSALYGIVPVPRTRLLCMDKDVIGTDFFLYDFMDGRLFTDVNIPELGASDRRCLYRSTADTMARIHAVDLDAAHLRDFGAEPERFLARQAKVWTAQYRAAETDDLEDMNHLCGWLPENIPDRATEVATVFHGDYRLDNLIFHPSRPDVVAVLDWELATIGHPLLDLAHLCLPYHLPPIPNSPVSGFKEAPNAKLTGIPSETEFLECYENSLSAHGAHVPIRFGPDGRPEDWSFFLSLAFFRGASILQGVYKRALQGTASAENAKAVGSLAKHLAKTGRRHADAHDRDRASRPLAAPTSAAAQSRAAQGTEAKDEKKSRELGCVPGLDCLPALSDRARGTLEGVRRMMEEEVIPLEKHIFAELEAREGRSRWCGPHAEVERLQRIARDKGLWNLFFSPHADPEGKYGPGFTVREYAPMAEAMGRSPLGPEIFNCQAPDTGNMELLSLFGTEEQKAKWLAPLTEGQMRSCFAMTEPGVASSDATNMEAEIRAEGDHFVVTANKWWTTGALDPHCRLAIVMGRAVGEGVPEDPPRHEQHSMVLVPMDAPGVKVVRPLRVMGYDDCPQGHGQVVFENVRVPKENLLGRHGMGFALAQGRLGPGRIHHCMRLVGMAERALELMCGRVESRKAFGKPLAQQGSILQDIAHSRCDIEQARLLTLQAAARLDAFGSKGAKADIGMIKIVAPSMALRVVDRAMQSFGGAGLSDDWPLARMWAAARSLRVADGPDEVHLMALGRHELRLQRALREAPQAER